MLLQFLTQAQCSGPALGAVTEENELCGGKEGCANP